jgi:hypothetical protein
MTKQIRDFAIRWIAVIFITLVLMECGARILVGSKNFTPDYEAAYNIHLQNIFLSDEYETAYAANPLFGFQANPRLHVNNYGFESSYSYPYKKRPNDFVVGVFGGSVAHFFTLFIEKHPEILNHWKEHLHLGRKNIVFLNLAQPAFRQPQQFIIASHFGSNLDLAITIDGNNEFIGQDHENLPPEYPSLANGLYFPTKEKRELANRIKVIQKIRAYIVSWPVKNKWLAKSSAYFLFWSNTNRKLNHWRLRLSDRLQFSQDTGLPFNFKKLSEERLSQKKLLWKKYTRLQQASLTAQNVRAVHFLQPIPHLKGSKPLTEEEKNYLMALPEAQQKQFDYIYRQVREEQALMKRSGLLTFDLTEIFHDQRKTLYIDNCCHLNDRGNTLMAENILKSLVQK